MAIILNFNPIELFRLKKGQPVTIEGRWILTDYKWVQTDRVNGTNSGGYASFSAYDSEYYMEFRQGFECTLQLPSSAGFEDSYDVKGNYSLNVNKNAVSIRLDGQTVRFSLLCLTNDTMQLYWTDGDKQLTMEEFFIFTRKK